jgi:uncharacterized protein involved in exopolysaccharide biosynthesis
VFARRRPQIAAVVAGALLVASAVAVVKPRDFRSETRLRITGASSLQADQLAQRVDALTREMVAPDTLTDMAQRLAVAGLDVHGLQRRTKVSAAPNGGAGWDVTIAHTAPDAAVALRVVETLASDYQTSAIQRPIQLKEQEIEALKTALASAQTGFAERTEELERYVLENQSYLNGPEERLDAVREQIRDVERIEIASYEGEIARLDELLEEEPEFVVAERAVRDDERIAEIRKEIRDVEAELTVLQVEQNRTDEHPTVVAKRKILSALEAELEKAQGDVRTEKTEKPNEMYTSLAKAKIEAEADLARARRKLSVLRTKEAELLEEVRRAPHLREERERLAQAVEQGQQTVDAAVLALETARAELQSLHEEQPLRFETLVPPETPDRPTGPGTLVIAGIGLLLGAFLGAGAACVVDARDRAFHDPRRVSAQLGLPTLGAIDEIRTPAEERRVRDSARRRTNTLTGMGLASIALLAFALLGDTTPLQDIVRSVLP